MISALLGALVFTIASRDSSLAVTKSALRVADVPVRISLNDGGDYTRGDRARVRVRLDRDGYLVVLRADVDGRVRVLFPLDPGDDDFVRGGKDYELPGRGGRETFLVDDREGAGTILAAISQDAFHYDRFVRGDHWDYRVLASDRMRDDPEAGLLDIVSAMADSSHFDYDVLGYSVDGAERYTYHHYGYGPRFGIGVGLYFGARYRCGYYDPFYDPLYCDPFFYDGFGYGYDGFGYGAAYYRPYRHSCFGDPFCFGYSGQYGYRRVGVMGGFSFKRPVPPPPLVLPRDRFPRTPVGFGDRTPLVTMGREPDRPVVIPRRREPPPPPARDARPQSPEGRPQSREARPQSQEGNGRSWSGGQRSSGGGGSTPRASTPSRSSGSRPSNSGTRRHQ
jgi:hypothetical protein